MQNKSKRSSVYTILYEDTTQVELDEITKNMSDKELYHFFKNKNIKFIRVLPATTKERLNRYIDKVFNEAIDNIIAIMKKGKYENLPDKF